MHVSYRRLDGEQGEAEREYSRDEPVEEGHPHGRILNRWAARSNLAKRFPHSLTA